MPLYSHICVHSSHLVSYPSFSLALLQYSEKFIQRQQRGKVWDARSGYSRINIKSGKTAIDNILSQIILKSKSPQISCTLKIEAHQEHHRCTMHTHTHNAIELPQKMKRCDCVCSFVWFIVWQRQMRAYATERTQRWGALLLQWKRQRSKWKQKGRETRQRE